MVVAPGILVQVIPSGDDCHWKVRPDTAEYPVAFKVKVDPAGPVDGDEAAVPPVRLAVQGGGMKHDIKASQPDLLTLPSEVNTKVNDPSAAEEVMVPGFDVYTPSNKEAILLPS
jgi:hypothetical protein